jgi:hypothetical protein
MKRLQVRYHAQPDDVIAVGELAEEGRQFFFEYDEAFLARGYPLSPFTFKPEEGWSLAPGYDLTFTEGPGGEHTTSVCGEGRAPGLSHVRRVAAGAGIEAADAAQILTEVRDAVSSWMSFARTCGVRKSLGTRIQKRLCLIGDG